ncbi:MAG TPA: hypothetical protein VHC46_06665 [Thermodesulfobacteriota bacterium]|nr:hypothetical protein [Thermodesulfobacteriota bacterium]
MRRNAIAAIFILFMVNFSVCMDDAKAGDADNVVSLLNTMYGNVCKAEVTGWFTKTLKIDWTPNTRKIDAIKVLAEIGTVKDILYKDGVRYLQFPNGVGTYNIIDWETGEKKSISDRAPYYFQ